VLHGLEGGHPRHERIDLRLQTARVERRPIGAVLAIYASRPIGTSRPYLTLRPLGAIRPRGTYLTLRARGTICPSGTLLASGAYCAVGTRGASRTFRPYLTLRTLRSICSSRANLALGSGLALGSCHAVGSGRTLRPGLTYVALVALLSGGTLERALEGVPYGSYQLGHVTDGDPVVTDGHLLILLSVPTAHRVASAYCRSAGLCVSRGPTGFCYARVIPVLSCGRGSLRCFSTRCHWRHV
jgi:hypothetical protein